MKSQFFYFFMLLIAPVVFSAEEAPCDETVEATATVPAARPLVAVVNRIPASSCSNGGVDLSKLRGICGFVYSKARSPAGSGYRYVYERMMNEAACVSSEDDASTKRRKVQALWDGNQTVFKCSASNFDVSEGNILKYSVHSRSYAFLNTAIENWNLNLNHIDPADNRTILDYVKIELDANAGNSDSSTIQSYYDVLRSAGAKFRSELI